MASTSLQRTLDRLRIVLAPELPDEYLLKKFISSRDEIAFATLVRRHGKMVLNVSRRVVGNLHDSEDVLQATFLVLAQKARLVANRDALASWLYRVAYRISLKAKAKNDRRRQMEKQVDLMSHFPSPAPQVRDWEKLLDEEINHLPEKYRLPIILCDLEGQTRKDVEEQLQLAAGTLSSRLARARRILADRLTRRGIVLVSGALWACPQATAALPAALVAATAHRAVLVAAGQFGTISSSVSVLMKAGVKAMFISKLKATVATVVVLASLGAGSLVYSGGGGTQSGPAKPQSELEKLRKENELLKVNLRVTLEKIQVLENELSAFKGRDRAGGETPYADWLETKRKGPGASPDNLHAQPWGNGQPRVKPSGDTTAPGRAPAPKPGPQTPGDTILPEHKSAAARLPNDAENVERPATHAKAPPLVDEEKVFKGLLNPSTALEELNRAFTTLSDPKADRRRESLRRAVQTLEQLLKQLRDVEDNRPDLKRP
jgi:RNA polymerase sigma factor (sigma-70 family)